MRHTLLAILILAGLAAPHAANSQGERYALIISGISGDDEHYKRFWTTSTELMKALVEAYGYSTENVWLLFEDKGSAEGVVKAESKLTNIEQAFAALQKKLHSDDSLLIVLVGHTDYDGRNAKFNIKGRDLADARLGELVDALPACRMGIAVTTANSGYFMKHLSKPGRIVITATKAGREVQETVFPFGFVRAFSDPKADLDKDGVLTLAEVFMYAQAYVEHFYKSKGLLRTEHGMLDDNGDKRGSRTLDKDAKDGKLAKEFRFEVMMAFWRGRGRQGAISWGIPWGQSRTSAAYRDPRAAPGKPLPVLWLAWVSIQPSPCDGLLDRRSPRLRWLPLRGYTTQVAPRLDPVRGRK